MEPRLEAGFKESCPVFLESFLMPTLTLSSLSGAPLRYSFLIPDSEESHIHPPSGYRALSFLVAVTIEGGRIWE